MRNLSSTTMPALHYSILITDDYYKFRFWQSQFLYSPPAEKKDNDRAKLKKENKNIFQQILFGSFIVKMLIHLLFNSHQGQQFLIMIIFHFAFVIKNHQCSILFRISRP